MSTRQQVHERPIADIHNFGGQRSSNQQPLKEPPIPDGILYERSTVLFKISLTTTELFKFQASAPVQWKKGGATEKQWNEFITPLIELWKKYNKGGGVTSYFSLVTCSSQTESILESSVFLTELHTLLMRISCNLEEHKMSIIHDTEQSALIITKEKKAEGGGVGDCVEEKQER